MLLEKHAKIVMTGDSLTDAGRARPVGTFRSGLGEGYVMMTQALLGACYPDHAIAVVNTGVSGDTIRDLDLRWETDVLALKPDYVSLMCGVNDVWRQFNIFDDESVYVLPEEYRSRYTHVIETTLPRVKGMFLLTPYLLEPNRKDAARLRVAEYGEMVKELAAKYGLRCLDTQKLFDDYTDIYHPFSISKDRVHLNAVGHMLLARGFLGLIGADIFR